jgi:hypothetical protein
MDGFPRELKAKAEMGVGPVGKQVGKKFGEGLMTGIGLGIAATVVVDFFKGAFAEAQEAAKVTRLTEAALKSTGNQAKITGSQISDLAGDLSNLSGVDDEVIQSSENVLLTFTKVRNEAGKGNDIFNQGTEAALNLSAALGTDLQAATLLVGKALNDPIGGLTALKKAGIQLTDQQKESIKTMVETGDVMGAQKVILGELTTQFGGAAEAAASPADKARVAWGNFQEMVGAKLMPMLNDILQFGIKNQAWLVPLVGSIASMALVIGTVIGVTKAWAAVQGVLGVGLDGTTKRATRAGLAITGMVIAAQAIDSFAGHATDIEGLADSIQHLGKENEISGELARLFGKDLAGFRDDAALAGDGVNGIARAIEGAIPGLRQLNDALPGRSFGDAQERIQGVDNQLADLVRNGNLEAARAAFFRLMQAGKLTADEAEKLMPKYANAMAEAERATGKLGDASQDAAEKGKSLMDVWDELNGKMLTADEAVLEARQAIDRLKDTFEEGGKSIDGMSLASSENRVELERSAQKSVDAALKYQENGHSAAEAATLLAKFKDEAIKNTSATGKNKDEIIKLADALFRIPEDVKSNVVVSVSGSNQLSNMLKQLDRVERGMADGGVLRSFANGGVARSFAGGGIEQHVAQVVKAGTWRVWGEDETGGEAYIPLATTKRTRSTAILADVARRFGFGLIRQDAAGDLPAAGGFAGGSGSSGVGRIAELLEKLIGAVERIAPGVGAEINGSMGFARQLGRAR